MAIGNAGTDIRSDDDIRAEGSSLGLEVSGAAQRSGRHIHRKPPSRAGLGRCRRCCWDCWGLMEAANQNKKTLKIIVLSMGKNSMGILWLGRCLFFNNFLLRVCISPFFLLEDLVGAWNLEVGVKMELAFGCCDLWLFPSLIIVLLLCCHGYLSDMA